jgi:hypothetical protein
VTVRPADDADAADTLFARLSVVREPMPATEYVVTFGCGVGIIAQTDGSRIEYEDHQSGCEHGIESTAVLVDDADNDHDI